MLADFEFCPPSGTRPCKHYTHHDIFLTSANKSPSHAFILVRRLFLLCQSSCHHPSKRVCTLAYCCMTRLLISLKVAAAWRQRLGGGSGGCCRASCRAAAKLPLPLSSWPLPLHCRHHRQRRAAAKLPPLMPRCHPTAALPPSCRRLQFCLCFHRCPRCCHCPHFHHHCCHHFYLIIDCCLRPRHCCCRWCCCCHHGGRAAAVQQQWRRWQRCRCCRRQAATAAAKLLLSKLLPLLPPRCRQAAAATSTKLPPSCRCHRHHGRQAAAATAAAAAMRGPHFLPCRCCR
jgi:hypothetical protein